MEIRRFLQTFLLSSKGIRSSRVSSTFPRAQVTAEWRTTIPRKRKAETSGSDYDLLLAEDVRIASKRACLHKPAGTITLGDAVLGSHGPMKLGPILSSRFGRR